MAWQILKNLYLEIQDSARQIFDNFYDLLLKKCTATQESTCFI